VELERRACPYDDSRGRIQGAKINISALRQVTRRFRPLLGAVGFLRDAYMRRTGCTAWTLPHLWTLGQIGTLIPTYLLRRRVDPLADGELPVLVAAIFKTLAGLFLSADALVIDAVLDNRAGGTAEQVDLFAANEPAAALTTDELVTLTNLLDVFGRGDAVCAGSPAMIDELVDVVISGTASVNNEGGRELAAILGNVEDFFEFAERMNAIMIGRDLLRHQLRDEHARLRAHMNPATRLPSVITEQILLALGTRDHAIWMRLYEASAVPARRAMTRWFEAIFTLADRARPSPAAHALVAVRSQPHDVGRVVDWMAREARVASRPASDGGNVAGVRGSRTAVARQTHRPSTRRQRAVWRAETVDHPRQRRDGDGLPVTVVRARVRHLRCRSRCPRRGRSDPGDPDRLCQVARVRIGGCRRGRCLLDRVLVTAAPRAGHP